MFQAHFGTARKLWTAEQVLAFAAEVGLDREGAAEAMDSRRYRDRVAADQRAAQRLGARGTPFIVLDGRYAIPGAIGTQDLLSALTTAWQESHPATISLLPGVAGTDGVCTPDGCVLPGQGDG